MKFPIYSIAVPILAVVGLAQDTPPVEPKKPVESASPAKTPDKTTSQAADRMQEMKTQTYVGTLVDASCTGTGSTSPASSTNPAASSADRTAASSADRTSSTGSTQGCALSASASQFALQMKDGRTVRFDDIGNTRVQEAMKTHKKWSDSVTANKPVRVKVSGVLNGDKLTVMSVD